VAATTLPVTAFPQGATRITGSATLADADAANPVNAIRIQGFATVADGSIFPAETTWSGGVDPETGEPIQPLFSVGITPAMAAFIVSFYTIWTPNGAFDFTPAMGAA
jgi:hypothetical protein